ncbi:MAG: HAD family phosphatase [Desulfobacterales bacterium]|nr:HAD family phosphatase [Desulfobacterales bacterium]
MGLKNKAVILDLGNVVLDWNVDRIVGSLGLEKEKGILLRKELFLHQDWLDMDHGTRTEADVISRVCSRSRLSKNTVETALLAAKNSLSLIPETAVLMREISDAGIDMFCLSNMSCETYSHIKGQEIFKLFRGIVISGIERCMKPDEDIYRLTLDRFGLIPGHTIFIDDCISNIEAAERLGISGFHFKRSAACYQAIRNILFGDKKAETAEIEKS